MRGHGEVPDGAASGGAWVWLSLAIAATSWGAILARLCASPPLTVALYRVGLAATFMAPWAGGSREGRASSAHAATAGAGVLLALHFATWIASLQFTSVAASTVLVSTQPVFAAVIAWVALGERPRPRAWAAMLLALAGAAVIASGHLRDGGGAVTGDLLALAGAVCAAGYLVVGRAARARLPFAPYVARVNLWAAAGALILAAAAGQPLRPFQADLPWLLLMALVPHVVGHGALNWAVRRLPAHTAGMAILGEPILASLYAWVLFAELPGRALYLGAPLVLSGITLAVLDGARRPGPAAAL